MRVFDPLHPLRRDFRSNDVTSGSLPVTWSRVTSFPVTWLRPASNSLLKSEMYSIRKFLALYRHFQVTSVQITWLLGHLCSPVATWPYYMSRDCHLLRATALQVVKCTVYGRFLLSTATFGWLLVKLRHFQVTSGHLRSCDVIFCHVTASCKLQPSEKWNVLYTRVFGLLQPLPGDFRSNDVTSGSLTVMWGHVTSFSFTWLPPPASYSLAGSEMYSIREVLALYSHFRVTSSQTTSLLGLFRSPEVTWRNLLSRDCLLLRATAL